MEPIKPVPKIIDDFLPAVPDLVVPVFHQYLSHNSCEKIVFNLKHQITDELIMPEKSKCGKWISVEEFINKVIARWEEEIYYAEKILCLKDQIIEEFQKFISLKNNSIEIQCLMENYQHSIIDKLFNTINFDEKSVAGDFCMGLLNGFHNDIVHDIYPVASYVLFTSFLTPYPNGLLELIKARLTNLPQQNVDNIFDIEMSKILSYIDEMRIKDKSIGEMSSLEEHKELFKKLSEERKICSVRLFDLSNKTQEFLPLLEENTKTCIESIIFIEKGENYIENPLDFVYKNFEVTNIQNSDLETFLLHVPWCMESFIIKIDEINDEGLLHLSCALDKMRALKNLRLQFSAKKEAITGDGTNKFFKCLIQLKNLKYFHLNFKFVVSKEQIDDLAVGIANMKKLISLEILFRVTMEISDCMFEKIANAAFNLTNLKNLSVAYFSALQFYSNQKIFNSNALNFFAPHLKNFSKLTSLQFRFENNNIKNEDINKLSGALASMQKLTSLKLILNNNPEISNTGFSSLCEGIKKLNELNQLQLCFDAANLDNASMEVLAKCLENLTNLCDLYLSFQINQSIAGRMTKIKKKGETTIDNLKSKKPIPKWASKFIFRLHFIYQQRE